MLASVNRIVSVPRGSWRWQNAYAIATYRPRRTLDGRWVWKSDGYPFRQKLSLPQLRRAFPDLKVDFGSLHNKPLTTDEIRMLALA